MTVASGPAAAAEAARRRTIAIISHPDAGKTTLTEKFLLYAGAVAEAGAVKARGARRRVTSDWMAMERERGISISSAVLQFTYRDHVLNLLDTPGHRDFSEDTYRVLAAVDSAIMLLDVAKGIEPQTRKLFEVCRSRSLPVLTFLNKCDRPGRHPLELLDEIEAQIGLRPTPVTWPVGTPGDFRGVVDRRVGELVRFARTAHGATAAAEERVAAGRAEAEEGDAWRQATEELALLDAVGADLDRKSFLAGESSPLFVGSAATNFGVRHLLDAVVDLAPAPAARRDRDGAERALDAPFAGFVFKVQANMDRSHRDHVAFLRVCSGRFERGATLVHEPTGRPFATKYATSVLGAGRETIDVAYPGDVVGLVNASDLQIGDSLFTGPPVTYPRLPSFAPELFAPVRAVDTGRYKQFHRGLDQLEREGVVQVLRDPGNQGPPVLGAVGPMQFEVLAHRMANEFGAPVHLAAARTLVARRTDEPTADQLRRRGVAAVQVLARRDRSLLALFDSAYWLGRVQADHPEWRLDPVLAEPSAD